VLFSMRGEYSSSMAASQSRFPVASECDYGSEPSVI
jgi:hypothetical protein